MVPEGEGRVGEGADGVLSRFLLTLMHFIIIASRSSNCRLVVAASFTVSLASAVIADKKPVMSANTSFASA